MNNEGTLIIAPIRPQAEEDQFPSAFANEIKGGHHQVNSIAERDSITSDRLQDGMLCTVTLSGAGYTTYRLENSSWVVFSSSISGSSGTIDTELLAAISGNLQDQIDLKLDTTTFTSTSEDFASLSLPNIFLDDNTFINDVSISGGLNVTSETGIILTDNYGFPKSISLNDFGITIGDSTTINGNLYLSDCVVSGLKTNVSTIAYIYPITQYPIGDSGIFTNDPGLDLYFKPASAYASGTFSGNMVGVIDYQYTASSTPITITTTEGELIDGKTSYTISDDGTVSYFVGNGIDWFSLDTPLQKSYDRSTDGTIEIDSDRGPFTVQSSPSISGSSIFQIKDENENILMSVMDSYTMIDGDFMPSSGDTYSLGTSGAPWKELYLTENSLYLGTNKVSTSNGQLLLNEQPVGSDTSLIASISGNLQDQIDLKLDTTAFAALSGSGSTDLSNYLTISQVADISGDLQLQITSNDGDISDLRTDVDTISGDLNSLTTEVSNNTNNISFIASISGDFARLALSNTFSGSNIFSGNVEVGGDLTVSGTTTTVNSQIVLIEDNIIELNSSMSGTPASFLTSGIAVNRGTSEDYYFLFRESDDSFVVGLSGSLQPVATRENTPINGGVAIWDSGTTKFVTSVTANITAGSFYGDGSNLTNLPSGGITVGDTITSGTANGILYEDGSNQIAQSSNLTYAGDFLSVIRSSGHQLELAVDGMDVVQFTVASDSRLSINGGVIDCINGFSVGTSVEITDIKDEDDMSSDSNTALATQQSIKAYVDSSVDGFVVLSTPNIGDLTVTGNISAGGFVYGDGSNLTNLPSSGLIEGDLSALTLPIATTSDISGAYFYGDGSNLSNLPSGFYAILSSPNTFTDSVTVSGSFSTGGSFTSSVRNITTSAEITTGLSTDHVIAFIGTTTHTYILPPCTSGRELKIKNKSTGTVTISGQGSDTIDDETYWLLNSGDSNIFTGNSIDWMVF